MFILNNIKVSERDQRTIGATQYPPDWFLDEAERVKVGMIEESDIPRPDDDLYTSVENPDGSWAATPRTAEDLAERLVVKALSARATRDSLIAATDWRFRSDLLPSQAWKDYCQALRDVTDQAGFPNEITWPTQPE